MKETETHRVRAVIWCLIGGLNLGVGIRNVNVVNLIIGAWLFVMAAESWSTRVRYALNRPMRRRR